jgi:hypothetical protein
MGMKFNTHIFIPVIWPMWLLPTKDGDGDGDGYGHL